MTHGKRAGTDPDRGQIPGWYAPTAARDEDLGRLAAMSVADFAIVGLDPTGRVLSWNIGATIVEGYTEEEALGRRLGEFFPDPLRGVVRAEEALRRAAETGHFASLSWRVRKNGEQFCAEDIIRPVRDGAGALIGFVWTANDVTDRERVLARFRLMESVVVHANDSVLITDTERADAPGVRIIYSNPEFTRMTGYTASEVLGRDPRFLQGPATDPNARARIRIGLDRREPVRVEILNYRKDGAPFWVDLGIVPVRDGRGRVMHFISIQRDTTERRREEESERFLAGASRILAGSLDYETTLDGLIRLIVPQWADFCMIDLMQYGGDPRRVAAADRDPAKRELVERLRRHAFAEPRPDATSWALRAEESKLVPEVTEAWLRSVISDAAQRALIRELAPGSAIVAPLRARGRTIGTILLATAESGRRFTDADRVVAEDLAGRAAVAIAHALLYREARDSARLRDEVLAVVSHDLRNPLGTIYMAAGLVLELLVSGGDRATIDRQLGIIQRSVERANRLIEDLLDVARIEAGRLSIETRALVPRRLVAEAVELHRPLAAEKSLRLETAVATGLPEVAADRDRIQQVFSNLIGNAIRFTPEHGRIVVGVKREDAYVVFSVSDTGPGIPEEDRPHLFDPFWQARNAPRHGAGLGLSIASGIVEAHGGRIGVTSRPGGGTTFRFTLPIAGEAERERREARI